MKNLTLKFWVFLTLIILLTSSIKPSDNHIATWYDRHGALTASGVRMHRDSSTCAYNALPMGTRLLVKNTSNNKECVVTITDRMGNKSTNRIDLSYKAFGEIANHSQGIARVIITQIK